MCWLGCAVNNVFAHVSGEVFEKFVLSHLSYRVYKVNFKYKNSGNINPSRPPTFRITRTHVRGAVEIRFIEC